MIKKPLALLLTVMMFFSCFTYIHAVELGQTVSDITLVDACFVRNGASYRDKVQGGTQLVIEKNANSKRPSFVKFDFAPYMDTLDYITKIEFSLTPYSGSGNRDFTLTLLPDNMENWSSSSLTFSMAEQAGMTADDVGQYLCTTSVTSNTQTTSADISSAVITHLKANTSNTIVAFKIGTTIDGAWVANGIGSKQPKLSVTVDIDAEDIVQNTYDGLTFDDINECTSDAVTSNFKLPTEGSYGTTIIWSSNDEDTIDPKSGIIARPLWNESDKVVELTALIENGNYSLTKTFTVVVKKGSVYPDDMVLEEYVYAADSTYVRRGKTDIYKGSLVLDSRNKDRMGFVKFDFTGYEEYLENANSMQLRMDTSTDVVSSDNDNFVVYVLPEEYEDIDTSTLTYTIANQTGLVGYTDNLVWVQNGLRASNTYRSGDILSAIKKNINEGNNSIVWIKVDSTQGVGFTMQGASASDTFKPALIIKYPKPASELDYYDLEIPTVVNSDIALPASGQFGSEITWSTSDESLIASDGTVTVATADEDYSKEDSTVTLEATISADGESLTKEFEVRVRRNGVIDTNDDATITSDGTYADDVSIAVGGTVNRIAFVSFDIEETSAQINASRKTVLKLYGLSEYADKSITLVPVTNETMCSNGIEAISYDDAQNIVNADNSFKVQADFENNSYVTFDVTEYMYSLSGNKALFALCSNDPQIILESLEGTLGKEPKLIVSPTAYTDEYAAQSVADEIEFSDLTTDNADTVRKNLTLPTSGRFGSTITWQSTNEAVVSSDGTVTRAADDTSITLTATVTVGGASAYKSFDFTVRKAETDLEYAADLAKGLAPDGAILTQSITLKGENLPDGAVASWESSEPYEAKVNGFNLELTRPNSADLPVTLTVSVTYNCQTAKESFNVTLVRSASKNILRNRKITSGDSLAEKAIDEDITTVWEISDSSVTFDLGSAKVISGMTMVPENGSFSGLIISVSDDMYQWKTAFTGGNFESGKLNYITFSPIAYGRYVKFDFPADAKAISFIGAYNFTDGNDEGDIFAEITIPSQLTSSYSLTQSIFGSPVTWRSSSNAVVINGYVATPVRGTSGRNVSLIAEVTINNELHTKSFTTYIPAVQGGSNGGGGSSAGGSGYVSPSNPAPVNPAPITPEPGTSNAFSDISDVPWAIEYINKLADMQIINGKSESIFAPNDNLKREEMAKILVLAFKLNCDSEDVIFADVEKNSWYADYVLALYTNNIANGIGDGNFGVGLDITRQDAFTMLAKVMGLDVSANAEAQSGFYDDADIASYARGAVCALKELGIVGGDNNGNVNPTAKITRAEIAKVVCLAMNK